MVVTTRLWVIYDIAMTRKNQQYDLGSMNASRTWSQRQFLDTMPIWFARRRSIAMSLCPSFQNVASIGESGKNMKEITENTKVRAPQ